jgi:hypothetical protein
VVQDTSGNVVRTAAGAVPVTNSVMKQEAANCGGLSSFALPILRRQNICRSAASRKCDRIFHIDKCVSNVALSIKPNIGAS